MPEGGATALLTLAVCIEAIDDRAADRRDLSECQRQIEGLKTGSQDAARRLGSIEASQCVACGSEVTRKTETDRHGSGPETTIGQSASMIVTCRNAERFGLQTQPFTDSHQCLARQGLDLT